MKRVTGEDEEFGRHKRFFELAAAAAGRATCERARCGSVIVKDGVVIGEGYNSPPLDDESRRTCGETWDYELKPKYDLTCCMHAEWRAVMDARTRNVDKIGGSVLYFMRIDEDGEFRRYLTITRPFEDRSNSSIQDETHVV
jgi:deoxycytidylate deaminase